jgi:hypothetical protein
MNSKSHPSFYENWWRGKFYWSAIFLWLSTVITLFSGLNIFQVIPIAGAGMLAMYFHGKNVLEKASNCPVCLVKGEIDEFNSISNELHLNCGKCKTAWNLELPKNYFRNDD